MDTGHGPLLPTVHGMTGIGGAGVKHKPPHVCVSVQVELKGQSSAPRVQGLRGGGRLARVRGRVRAVMEIR